MGMTYVYMCSMAIHRTLVASVRTLRTEPPSLVVSSPYEDSFLFRHYICYSALKRTE